MEEHEYYEAIEEAFLTTDSDIFINASAGSGKSTTIVKLAKLVPTAKSVIFLAFNKSIQEELRLKLPSNIDVSTIHSKAYGVLRSNVKMNVKLNELKNFIYCKQNIKQQFKNKKKENAYYFGIADAINYLKSNNSEPTTENINSLCYRYGLSLTTAQIQDTIKVFKKIELEEQNLNKKSPSNIDFMDMLYLCAKKVKPEDYPKYDIVIVDEQQDLSVIQQHIVLNLLSTKGRLISVGDEKQTIYGFQGASLETMNVFRNRPNTKQFALPVTYRCSKAIVDYANTIFPNQTVARETAIQGQVRTGDYLEAETNDMIVCRNNKPLVMVWVELAKAKKKATILGKDFGLSLKRLIDSIDSIQELNKVIEDKYKELKDAGVANPINNPSYIALQEKIEILKILHEEFGSTELVSTIIDEIFSNVGRGIIMSSIHKSKGLEAERVFILNYDLIPSPYAITEEQLFGERALQYVAVTRGKKDLIFCNIQLN